MSDDKKVLRNFFNGLPQEILREIISLSAINRLNHGEFFESDTTDTICIVIDGEIVICEGNNLNKPVLTIKSGECARQTLPKITVSPATDSSAMVMVLNKRLLDMMPEQAQLFLYKKIYESDNERISKYLFELRKCDEKKAVLVNSLKQKGLQKNKDLSEFEPVRKILDKIQRLPSSIENLMAQISSEKTTPRSIADIIKNDPSLTGIVLKRINSSYYCLEKKISDINYAIFFLGVDQIYQVIVAEGLRSTLASNPEFQKLYFHSVIISHISSEIARLALTSQPAIASTIALLHDLGKNVKFLLKEQNPKIIDLIDFLEAAEIGNILLKSWNLPENICEVVKFHMHPDFMHPDELPQAIRPAVINLYVSHLVYDQILSSQTMENKYAYEDECLDFLGWSGYDIKKVIEKILMPEFKRRSSLYPESFRKFLKIEKTG